MQQVSVALKHCYGIKGLKHGFDFSKHAAYAVYAPIDGKETAAIDRAKLLQTLSTGEKKALYILNVIFEIETRLKAGQETLVIVDDVADSFDYQNKYAIIQYLKYISEYGNFKQIILTHNFDFFRTVSSRFVGYSGCLMATKTDDSIVLNQAVGIRNVFANDWKPDSRTSQAVQG